MDNIIIPASKSMTLCSKMPRSGICRDIIIIGKDGENNYDSYLYFDISCVPSNIKINSAKIILFKKNVIPARRDEIFYICPLREYFGMFTNFENKPEIYEFFREPFYPFACENTTKINITDILNLWIKGIVVNRGLALIGRSPGELSISFASAYNKNIYLVPVLVITYGQMKEDEIIEKGMPISTLKYSYTLMPCIEQGETHKD